ncbi:hypothetical protein GALMADRAFT_258828 [Galerina marginata CBS 339.88]|uniref:Threonine/serine exporter-like N-terminal domain-containing protein n=1 Tax=Galerina marginata (strain CBS 339.88) TaxID=685588 RepID=A0A067SAJ6_GALM3|nr:hypothetical protein GALMADRAFT_258828 [Galerina marginata CBS 339.88]
MSSTSRSTSSSTRRSDTSQPNSGTAAAQTPTAFRTPGVRTPRKVQWGNDAESSCPERLSTHMLDEKGEDSERFKELTAALERHRRETPLKKVHYYPPEDSPSPSSSGEISETDNSHSCCRLGDRHPYINPSTAASSEYFDSTQSIPFIPPTRNVPGNDIEEEEDGGLPGTRNLRNFSMKKAQNLVKPHIRQSAPGRPRQYRKRQDRQNALDAVDGTKEKGVQVDKEPSLPSSGILSTLLKLYHQPNFSISDMSSSLSSYDEGSEHGGWEGKERETTKLVSQPQAQSTKPAGQRRFPSIKLPSIFGHVARPTTARSAGGVFGPLIASTGNLTGVVAPHSSTLQPNVKRPGYRLSRYTLDTPENLPAPPPPARPKPERAKSYPIDATATPPASPANEPFYRGGAKSNLSNIIGGYASSIGRMSGYSTPRTRPGTPDPHNEKQHAPSCRHRRTKRKRAEVYITRHVADIIRREEFIMKLTRAMMMFGGPSHRLQGQILSAARVLDIQLSFLYLPDIVLISFDDSGTGTSHIKLIRQTSALDIEKLTDAFRLYWKVIHDKLSVSDASLELDELMKKKPFYNWWQQIFIGGMCSASICTVSFGGSFVDSLMSFPLGALLVLIQVLSVRNVLYSYVFEVTVTTLFSFIAAAVASSHKLCYSAVTSSSVVLILPGFLVLNGALELMTRNIIPGSVRLLFSIVYALFLGFGFSIGGELFELFTSHQVYGADDFSCSLTHDPSGPWYQRTPSTWWAFLTVPMFSLFLSMRNQAPYNRKEMPLLVAIACAGWVTNYFVGRRYVGQSDIIAAVGAFAVGLISNLYARIFSGNAFVVMITGILFQLPSGLGSGGLLSYASQQTHGNATSYISGFRTALKLVAVGIGLTIGLGLSLVLAHPIQSRKREAGIFSL